jgi:hypothetical protein
MTVITRRGRGIREGAREQEVSEISFQQQENFLQHPNNSLQQEEALFAAAKEFVCSSKKFCLQQQKTFFATTKDWNFKERIQRA